MDLDIENEKLEKDRPSLDNFETPGKQLNLSDSELDNLVQDALREDLISTSSPFQTKFYLKNLQAINESSSGMLKPSEQIVKIKCSGLIPEKSVEVDSKKVRSHSEKSFPIKIRKMEHEMNNDHSQYKSNYVNNNNDVKKHLQSGLPETPKFTCPKCGNIFSYKRSLIRHLRDLHSAFLCLHCDKNCSTDKELINHLRIFHKVETVNNLPIVIESIQTQNVDKNPIQLKEIESNVKSTLYPKNENHLNETKTQKHSCFKCHKFFRHKRSLIRHLRDMHSGLRSFPCLHCDAKCNTDKELTNHLQLVHKLKAESLLQINSSTASGLKHKIKVEPQDPLECNALNDITLDVNNISNFKIKQEDSKSDLGSIFCFECEHQFSETKDLLLHVQLLHTKKPQHTCFKCGKLFQHKRSLVKHLKDLHSYTGSLPNNAQLNPDGNRINYIHSVKTESSVHIDSTIESKLKNNSNLEHPDQVETITQNVNIKSNSQIKQEEKSSNVRSLACLICENQFHETKDLLQHIQLVHSKTPKHSCSKCGKLFQLESSLIRHSRDLHSATFNFPCLHCDAKFDSHKKLISHLNLVHNMKTETILHIENIFAIESKLKNPFKADKLNQLKNEIQTVKSTMSTSPIKLEVSKSNCKSNFCIECAEQFDDVEEFDEHLKLFHEKAAKHACIKCGKLFLHKRSMTKHLRELHSASRMTMCLQCDKKCHSNKELIDHLKLVHNIKTITCTHCEKSFKCRRDLKRHMNSVHLKMKIFPCLQCDKKFAEKHHVEKHVRGRHMHIKAATCELCNKAFLGKSELNRHNRAIHLKLRPYSCAKCNKTYSERFHMKIHNC